MLKSRQPKARRQYTCRWCDEAILPASIYHYQTWVDDDRVFGERFHVECFSAAEREWDQDDLLEGDEFIPPENRTRGKTRHEDSDA